MTSSAFPRRAAGSLLLLAAASLAPAQTGPLTLTSIQHYPEITGDFNHFGVDLAHNRLFTSNDIAGTVELFELSTGKHLQTSKSVKEPHMLAYAASTNELWTGDAATHALVALNADDFHVTARLPLPNAPTMGAFDTETQTLYIEDGGKEAKLPYTTISIVDIRNRKITATVRVDDADLEGLSPDRAAGRLYVSQRVHKAVGVIDLKTAGVIASWPIAGVQSNTPLATDTAGGRIFTSDRGADTFYVLDASSGKIVFQGSCVTKSDDIQWDPVMKRVYITGLQGLTIYRQDDPDHYSKIDEIPTNGGKISVVVPSLHRLYTIHPNNNIDTSAMEIFRINP